jgi:hypothetical protein
MCVGSVGEISGPGGVPKGDLLGAVVRILVEIARALTESDQCRGRELDRQAAGAR